MLLPAYLEKSNLNASWATVDRVGKSSSKASSNSSIEDIESNMVVGIVKFKTWTMESLRP